VGRTCVSIGLSRRNSPPPQPVTLPTSAARLRAAFRSRSSVNSHWPHVQVRSEDRRSSVFAAPQLEQVLVGTGIPRVRDVQPHTRPTGFVLHLTPQITRPNTRDMTSEPRQGRHQLSGGDAVVFLGPRCSRLAFTSPGPSRTRTAARRSATAGTTSCSGGVGSSAKRYARTTLLARPYPAASAA
jgi:hypothetical protein